MVTSKLEAEMGLISIFLYSKFSARLIVLMSFKGTYMPSTILPSSQSRLKSTSIISPPLQELNSFLIPLALENVVYGMTM